MQALWNFEGLQNIGFLFALLPFLKKCYPDKEKRQEAYQRHLEFFNTQPYMASIIIGLTAKMEEKISEGSQNNIIEISNIKKNMAGPLAAMGDALFWATLRPFAAILATGLIFIYVKSNSVIHPLIIPAFFLVIYNSVQLTFRYMSLRISYELGEKIIEKVASVNFQSILNILRFVSVIILSLIALYYFISFGGNAKLIIAILGTFVLTIFWTCLRWPIFLLFYFIIISGVLISIFL